MYGYPISRCACAPAATVRFLSKVVLLILVGLLSGEGQVFAQTTTWVSRDSDGNEGNGWNYTPSVSAEGRYVAFQSDSNNLVSEDTNTAADIFVHDVILGETSRVSVDSNGNEGVTYSSGPWISANGRYVAFESDSNNLVPEDTNGERDIFVHDRATGETTRVSVASNGEQGNGPTHSPFISVDGRYVTFSSYSNNFVPIDSNGWPDIFLHDRATGETTRVSVDSEGNEASGDSYGRTSISADGRYVVFWSFADNLVHLDTNGQPDIFVHDRVTGQTTRVNVDSDGNEANDWTDDIAAISPDGRYIAFSSRANNLVAGDTNGRTDIFVHDHATGETTRVSVDSDDNQGNHESYSPSFSADGRYVAFYSWANNLVSGDTNEAADIFVHDRDAGQIIRVSVDSDGNEANSDSGFPLISADGRRVVFESTATNLVPEDTYSNYWATEIFVHGPLGGEPMEVSIDVAPNRDPNRIRPERGSVVVAILGVETFDPTQVDPDSVRFGPEEAEASRDRIVDVDRDGDWDRVLYFRTAETGIACGDVEATLTGETVTGTQITGTDSIQTIGCKSRER